MQVVFPSYHYDAISEFSHLFRMLGWDVGLVSPELVDFGMQRSLSDPEGFDRMDHQQDIAAALQMRYCRTLDDLAGVDIVLVNSVAHKKIWDTFAETNNLDPVVISIQQAPPVHDSIKNLLTPDQGTYNKAPHGVNKVYWNGILSDIAEEYAFIGPRESDVGFFSYINRIEVLLPDAYVLCREAKKIYRAAGGKQVVRFFGQNCPDGCLHNGRYGQKDEVLKAMRRSLATLHIKDIDRPGMVILRTMLLGKPLIVWEKLVRNSQMHHLLNTETCYPVTDAAAVARVMRDLESGVENRERAINAARRVREICTWEQFKPQILAFLDRALSEHVHAKRKQLPTRHREQTAAVAPHSVFFERRPGRLHSFAPLISAVLQDRPGPLSVVEWGPGANTELFLASPKVTRVVGYESETQYFEQYKKRFSMHSARLDLCLKPFAVTKPVTFMITAEQYRSDHSYVTDALRRYGENSFDIAFIDGGGYRTDCAEISQLLVKDGGYIIWHDIVSYRENNPEFPSGRTYQSVLVRFAEYTYFDDLQTVQIVNRKNSAPYSGDRKLSVKAFLLKKIFTDLQISGIRYVVLRNFDDIPTKCSLSNDIDLAVHPDDMSSAHTILMRHLPQHQRDKVSRDKLLYGARVHNHYLLPTLNIHIDVVQGLYYTSLNNGEKIPAPSVLQDLLFKRRRVVHDFWGFIPIE
jgi:hypothetical protein